jgi:hypothetical protein
MTKPLTITRAKVLAEVETLRDSRKKNPWVYEGSPEQTCVYTSPTNLKRHCIAGEVLNRLGAPLPDPRHEDETLANEDTISSLASGWLVSKNVLVDKGALDLLYALQQQADTGMTWGRAIKEAGI